MRSNVRRLQYQRHTSYLESGQVRSGQEDSTYKNEFDVRDDKILLSF